MIGGPGLITRGLGTPTIVARGNTSFIGAIVQTVVETSRRVIRGGRSAAKKVEEYWYKVAVAVQLLQIKSLSRSSKVSNVEGATYAQVKPNQDILVNAKYVDHVTTPAPPIMVTGQRIK
jgi:hypothetical protein